MKKTYLNYLIDLLMLVAGALSAFSGLALLFMPRGRGFQRHSFAYYSPSFAGIQKHFWIDIHDWSSILLILIVILHLILHWNWIVCVTKSFFTKRAVLSGNVDFNSEVSCDSTSSSN